MAKSIAFTIALFALVAVAAPVSQSHGQGLFARLQPTSPSDQPPVELLPPQPTRPNAPQFQQSAQQPLMVQKSYIVQKSAALCPAYCISYHNHRKLRKRCCGYCTPIKTIVAVPDPSRCGCAAEVCITIPSCCTGAPCVTSKVGLFGRGIVIYKWPTGQMVQVIFKKHTPHVMVHNFY